MSEISQKEITAPSKNKLTYCSQCDKYFSTLGNLRNHIMTIHENKRPFKCNFPNCTKSYSIESRLQVHYRIHTGTKPFVCKECGKAFNEKGNLKTHQRFHSEQRPFKCPNCPKTYKTNGHLKDHIEIQHLNIRKFNCTFCDKKFGRISTLKAHIRTHTGEKNFMCGVEGCGKCFAEKGNMEIHYKRHLRRLEKQRAKEEKQCIKVEFSLCEENEGENALTRPSSNNTLFTNAIGMQSPMKEETVKNYNQSDSTIIHNELIEDEAKNTGYLFYEPNQESEINKIDLGYLDNLNELNFDFDNNFMMSFEK